VDQLTAVDRHHEKSAVAIIVAGADGHADRAVALGTSVEA
jgi:hypothetical protein